MDRVFDLLHGKLGWSLLLAAGIAFPFVAGNDYHLTVMSTAYIFALATVGLNLITGYTGQFNLAHAGFMAVGAYPWAWALEAESVLKICTAVHKCLGVDPGVVSWVTDPADGLQYLVVVHYQEGDSGCSFSASTTRWRS